MLFNLNVYYLAPEIIRKLQAVVAGRDLEEVPHITHTFPGTYSQHIPPSCWYSSTVCFYYSDYWVSDPGPVSQVEFTEYTDVYALGTVWYEILAGHWPWPGLSPEQVLRMSFQTCLSSNKIVTTSNWLIQNCDNLFEIVITDLTLCYHQVWWHVGKGIVPDVSSSTPELSTLLLQCWSSDHSKRPNAAYLAKEINSLPLPRILHRSPSHPVGLKSRSWLVQAYIVYCIPKLFLSFFWS